MALSDEEQRLLDQLEAALAADDPKLAHALRGTTVRRVHRRRATLSGIGLLAGLGLLVGGIEIHPAVSILGFLVMLAAAVAGLSSFRSQPRSEHEEHRPTAGARPRPGQQRQGRAGGNSGFMDRMEERWRRRQDEGL